MKLYDNITRFLGKKGISSAPTVGQGDFFPAGIISDEEKKAMVKSFDIYKGRAPWLTQGNKGLSLASGISSELARLTLTEFSITFGDKNKDALLSSFLSGFISRLRTNVEYACATGGVIFKPCCNGKVLTVKTVLPFDFIPLAIDGNGNITSCAFIERATQNCKEYIKLETHSRCDDVYTVDNRAYLYENGRIQREVPLSSVKEWEQLSPRVDITGLRGPLFSYFPIPEGNLLCVSSPLGVPVFRRAEGLIKEADLQFGRLLWEFEGGELAIDASEDAFRIGKDGKPRLPDGKERLYRTNALDACCSSNELLKIFAPELRDKSIINGLNRIIMFVEDACGIARGTFSDPSEVAKTATEVRSMRQRTFATVSAIQVSLKSALTELIRAMNDMAMLYGIWDSDTHAKISFGDGVLTDSLNDRAQAREDVRCGIITPEEYRENWYK